MRATERTVYILAIFFLSIGMVACANAPTKSFTTRKFQFNNSEAPCLWYNENGPGTPKRVCPDEEGYPQSPVVLDIGKHGIGGWADEIGYQDLLKKECRYWK